MPPAPVTLIYRPKAQAHYVARLGRGGWCEGWGWNPDDAVADLGRVIQDVRPTGVPSRALADREVLLEWLQHGVSDAELDE